MTNIINFLTKIKEYLNFHFYFPNILCLIILIGLVPGILYLPAQYGYENGFFENLQMFFLFLSCIFALKSKTGDNKKFFTFVFLVLTILILREVNCGRTIFFAVPGQENAFYSWKQIKYGWLAHPIFGTYIGLVAIYFLKNKLYLNIWQILKTYRLPIWNTIFMVIGMILGTYAEEVAHNPIMEEISELLFYFALCSIIYLYTLDKNFLENTVKKNA